MDFFHRLELWGKTHHPKWVDYVRIALGVFLVIKGLQFPGQMSILMSKLPNVLSAHFYFLSMLQYYILFAHLLGGLFLIGGIFVRFACVIQIPILIGAIIFVNSPQGVWTSFSELSVSVIVFLLLCYFLIAGNGSLSVARYLKDERDTHPGI